MESRKHNRLENFDYSTTGYYFITVCTAKKQKILCDIVGCGILDAPKITLSETGKIVKNQLDFMSDFYDNIKIDKYIIMPNHLHIIIKICGDGGVPRTSHPTDNLISNFVGTFKRFSNKYVRNNIWQKSFYDHIIRDENDYLRIWEYIENNPAKWTEDEYYSE